MTTNTNHKRCELFSGTPKIYIKAFVKKFGREPKNIKYIEEGDDFLQNIIFWKEINSKFYCLKEAYPPFRKKQTYRLIKENIIYTGNCYYKEGMNSNCLNYSGLSDEEIKELNIAELKEIKEFFKMEQRAEAIIEEMHRRELYGLTNK